ncbi:beta-lactamase-like protein [Leptodontidium sp. MPI-SDFR-AT-0119]|nr:beta-lactamase-like protein [Leptodontidium sp. MPI-SDFR-AT-0119]
MIMAKPIPDCDYAKLSILPSGTLTLPERFFCADQHDKTVRNTVPSLSFLIYHPPSKQHIIFDLGMRRDLSAYPATIQPHLRTRQPIQTTPDTAQSLRKGGLEPFEIGAIILSHVHYDHVGTPSDFPNAYFIVGYGTRHLLQHGMKYHSAAHFESDLLPEDRTSLTWSTLPPFPNAIDLFDDGLIYIIDSPGHLQGHLNVLARVSAGQWIYLAGDACHHSRILDGETEIATWEEGGQHVCIHSEKDLALETLERIVQVRQRGLLGAKVEVVLAHDAVWFDEHKGAIFPGTF